MFYVTRRFPVRWRYRTLNLLPEWQKLIKRLGSCCPEAVYIFSATEYSFLTSFQSFHASMFSISPEFTLSGSIPASSRSGQAFEPSTSPPESFSLSLNSWVDSTKMGCFSLICLSCRVARVARIAHRARASALHIRMLHRRGKLCLFWRKLLSPRSAALVVLTKTSSALFATLAMMASMRAGLFMDFTSFKCSAISFRLAWEMPETLALPFALSAPITTTLSISATTSNRAGAGGGTSSSSA
ncbi:hypothetical protein B484DRAFT_461662, partial [Ochromonadaceae sp. CCMP2298]